MWLFSLCCTSLVKGNFICDGIFTWHQHMQNSVHTFVVVIAVCVCILYLYIYIFILVMIWFKCHTLRNPPLFKDQFMISWPIRVSASQLFDIKQVSKWSPIYMPHNYFAVSQGKSLQYYITTEWRQLLLQTDGLECISGTLKRTSSLDDSYRFVTRGFKLYIIPLH